MSFEELPEQEDDPGKAAPTPRSVDRRKPEPRNDRVTAQDRYPTPGVLRLPVLHGTAACVERRDLDWDEGTDLAENRRVCRNCEVRTECLRVAVANQEPYGVWAGLTPGQRRKLARRSSDEPDTLPPHGTNSRYCHYKCRCTLCRLEHAAYERARRARERDRRGNDGELMQHADSPGSPRRVRTRKAPDQVGSCEL